MIGEDFLKDPGLLLCAGEAELPVILSGKELTVKLLSVYDNAVCIKNAKKLQKKLQSDGISDSEELAKSAALCAGCLYDGLGRVFDSADEAILRLTADEAAAVCGVYAKLRKEDFDTFALEESDIDRMSSTVSRSLLDRIRWRVMRTFRCLPQDPSFKRMTDGQFLFCYINILADEGGEFEQGINEGYHFGGDTI